MNLLLTGAFSYSDEQLKKLSALGYNVYFMQYETEVLPLLACEVDVVVCNGLFLHHDIDDFKQLKLVQLISAGFDRVPVDIIKSRGIKLMNAKGVYSIPMAEWAMMRVLQYYKKLSHFEKAQIDCSWNKCRTLREITGIEVAVIGAGNVGQEVAKRFSAFGARLTGFDVHTNAAPYFDEIELINRLFQMVGMYDVVIITAPLTSETYHLISRDVIKSMKQGAMLVNIARGQLIDERALIEVLREDRQDLCVALDVFEVEPLAKESPLWRMKNVVVSPHNSFVSNCNCKRMFDLIYNNLKLHIYDR